MRYLHVDCDNQLAGHTPLSVNGGQFVRTIAVGQCFCLCDGECRRLLLGGYYCISSMGRSIDTFMSVRLMVGVRYLDCLLSEVALYYRHITAIFPSQVF